MSIEIIPTGAALGAEISGVDLAQPVDDTTFAAIEQAYNDPRIPEQNGLDRLPPPVWRPTGQPWLSARRSSLSFPCCPHGCRVRRFCSTTVASPARGAGPSSRIATPKGSVRMALRWGGADGGVHPAGPHANARIV